MTRSPWWTRRPLVALAAVSVTAFLPQGRLRAQTVEEARVILRQLVEVYGPSGHEAAVRASVQSLLPSWAHPTTDTAGDLLVRVGQGAPLTVFIAHLDEIGFEVTSVREDGQLTLRALGGFMPSLFEAEPALVHTARGAVPAVFTLRDSLGAAPRRTPVLTGGGRPQLLVRVDPGTGSRAGTGALGIAVGDVVTMPKQFVSLAGTRATARSFDDRVGCTAQLLAIRHLDPLRLPHAVLFVFSVREEVGLDGARAVATSTAAEAPARVYALDTFVSADGPLEIKTFADAPLGRGAVARAIDNSSVTPPALVDSLVRLARLHRVPLQVGTTNGGNDGSVFTRYGTPDVGIGWPLRYAHSPAEVIDLRDVVAMAQLTLAVVEHW